MVNLAMNVVNYDDRYGDPYEFRLERFNDYPLRAGAYMAMRYAMDPILNRQPESKQYTTMLISRTGLL